MLNPPTNTIAETAVLGAILFENRTLWRVSSLINPDDFANETHGALFQAMLSMIPEGEVCDDVTLKGRFDVEWLGQLLEACPDMTDVVEAYANEIRDCAVRRKLMVEGHSLVAAAARQNGKAALEDHESALQAIQQQMASHAPVMSCADRPEDIFATSDHAALVKTGIGTLDRGLRGFERGAMSIIGARPGIGKSALAVAIGGNVAARESVGFVSCDMKEIEVRRRLACFLNHQAGRWTPTVSDLKEPGRISAETREDLLLALATPQARQFFINDKHGQTVGDIATQIRAWKRHCSKHDLPPLGIVFVDHIAKIAPRQRWNSLYEKTSFACNELLDVAKQHPDVAIVALCQLNRESDKVMRSPAISDLRDSGKIEEDATAILLIHREDHYWEDRKDNEALDQEERAEAQAKLLRCKGQFGVLIGKNRNDRKQTVTLHHSIALNVICDQRDHHGRSVA
ncbi:MAG TPA: replicative DNA helicase [Hyphomonas sp.]|nr:replicative DNA helicase [Hyphomonas sp.]